MNNMKNVSDNVIRKTTENINTNEVDILPINTGIIIQFYDDNPYRVLETSKSGIIQGIETSKKHFSNETGEIEKDTQVVTCAKVIEVGKNCIDVQKGDDVYLARHMAIPLPFRKKGYYIVHEQHIMCRITKKD